MFRTLRSRITVTYFLVVLISLILAGVFFAFFLSRYHRDTERDELKAQVRAVAGNVRRWVSELGVSPFEEGAEDARLQRLVQGMLNSQARVLKAKLVIVDAGGLALAEARRRPVLGKRELRLPSGFLDEEGTRVMTRTYPLLGGDYLFVSSPTLTGPGETGFLIAIQRAGEVGGVASSMLWYIALAGVIAFAASMMIALYLSGAISRPVREVAQAARKMAGGDYRQEVSVEGSDELSELGRDFNLMAGQVRKAYERQRDFVADVSHELRTPLTSIEGFSTALADGVVRDDEEKAHAIRVISEESRRMVRVLNDLLLLSEIDSGVLRLRREPVDISELLLRMEDLYRAKAEEAGVELSVDVPQRVPEVITDGDRLERVLTNLLDNAVKYTRPGGAVGLSTSTVPGGVAISVSDTGPGIDADLLPYIFERFYRVEKSRATRHGGAGLGLSICRELVESLGGAIEVESRVGEGTVFTVRLPL